MTQADRIAEAGRLTSEAARQLSEGASPRVVLAAAASALTLLDFKPERSLLSKYGLQRSKTLNLQARCLTEGPGRAPRPRDVLHALAALNKSCVHASHSVRQYVATLVQRGALFELLGDDEAAQADYRRVHRFAPGNREAALYRAEQRLKAGHPRAAADLISRVLAGLGPGRDRTRLLRRRAACNCAAQRFPEALEDANQARREATAGRADLLAHLGLLDEIASGAGLAGHNTLAEELFQTYTGCCREHLAVDGVPAQLAKALTNNAEFKFLAGDIKQAGLLLVDAESIAAELAEDELLTTIAKTRRLLQQTRGGGLNLPAPDFLEDLRNRKHRIGDEEWQQRDPLLDAADYVAMVRSMLSSLPSDAIIEECKPMIARLYRMFLSEHEVQDHGTVLDLELPPDHNSLIHLIRRHYSDNHQYERAHQANETALSICEAYGGQGAHFERLWQAYLDLQTGATSLEQAAERCSRALDTFADWRKLRSRLGYFIIQLQADGRQDWIDCLIDACLRAPAVSALPIEDQADLRLGLARRFAQQQDYTSAHAVLEPVDRHRERLPDTKLVKYLMERAHCLCADRRYHRRLVSDLQEAITVAAAQATHENDGYWAKRQNLSIDQFSDSYAQLEREALESYISDQAAPQRRTALFRHGDALTKMGRYDAAEERFFGLLSLYPPVEECSDADRQQLSAAHSVLATLAAKRNDKRAFDSHMEKAFATCPDPRQKSLLLSQQVGFLTQRDLLEDAQAGSDEALSLQSRVGVKQHVIALNNRAKIQERRGDFEAALELRTRAIRSAAAENVKGKGNRKARITLRRTLAECADLHLQQWNATGKTDDSLLAAARAHLNHALQMAPDSQYDLNRYHLVLRAQGDSAGALRILQRAAKLLNDEDQKQHEQYGYVYAGIVSTLFDLGDYKRCLRCCKQFVGRGIQLPPANTAALTVQHTMAKTLHALGRVDEARRAHCEWFTQAADFARGIRDDELYRLLAEELWDCALEATEGLIELSEDDPDALSEALWQYECFLNLQTGSAPHLHDPALERARAKFEGRLQELSRARQQDDEPDPKWLKRVESKKLVAIAELDEAISTAAREHPRYQEWLTRRFAPLSTAGILSTVPSGTIVLVPFCGPGRAGWFVLSSSRRLSFVPWGLRPEDAPTTLQGLSDSFLGRGEYKHIPMRADAITPPFDDVEPLRAHQWRSAGTALFRPLVRALASAGDNGGFAGGPIQLLVLTTDSLHDVAWQALYIETDEGDCRRLGSYFSVCETPTLRTRTQQDDAASTPGRPVVFSIVDPASELPCLPGTDREREALAHHCDESSEYFPGEAATISLLEYPPHESLQRANILHLACHGQVAQDSPLLAYLALAPADGELARQLQVTRTQRKHAEFRGSQLSAMAPEDPNGSGGQYFVWKFDQLPLSRTELVILSCCQLGRTGGGRRDAAYGLMRSLAFAGARAVLAHRWDAHDVAAGEFVAVFTEVWVQPQYRGRIGPALREAQRLFLDRHGAKYGHEYYWAGWSAYDLS